MGGAASAVFGFTGVEVRKGGRRLLREVAFEVPGRGVTAVVGPSGSGKTTLLRLCNRLEVPTEGTVRFRGRDVATLHPPSLRRRVGMVFQRPVLFGGTVRDNLAVADARGGDAEFTAMLGRVSLDPDVLDRPAATLSGGEAQRVCLARTLVTRPEVLLLDEPTSALDATPRAAFEDLVRDLVDGGMPVLWVTHDLDQMRRVADTLVVLDAGRVIAAGPAAEVTRDAEALAGLDRPRDTRAAPGAPR